MNSYTCECGCGNIYKADQMVRRFEEILYIPHCIEVFGLFKPPQEIREHLNHIFDYEYIFPGEIVSYQIVESMLMLKSGWEQYSSKYGLYYVRKPFHAQGSLQVKRW